LMGAVIKESIVSSGLCKLLSSFFFVENAKCSKSENDYASPDHHREHYINSVHHCGVSFPRMLSIGLLDT
jgi:hypothetical protein